MNGKFRAWDNENNKYFKPTYKAYVGQIEELLISQRGRLALRTTNDFIDESMFPDRFIVEHYTGLNDKNGKEIYEGDILRNVLNCLVDKEPFQIIFSTDWSGWYWKNTNDNWDCFYDSIAEDCEIIGNIHENLELMKGVME